MARLQHRVYARAPFAGPERVLDDVGRYTHRVAIANNRLLDIDHGQVSFRWKDYRQDSEQKKMTLSVVEFILRFLPHLLPNGFQRIRYYGFLAERYRREKLARCRHLLGMHTRPRRLRFRRRRITVIASKNSPVARYRNARSAIEAACWWSRCCPVFRVGSSRSWIPHDAHCEQTEAESRPDVALATPRSKCFSKSNAHLEGFAPRETWRRWP